MMKSTWTLVIGKTLLFGLLSISVHQSGLSQNLPAPQDRSQALQSPHLVAGFGQELRAMSISKDRRWMAWDSGVVWDLQQGRIVGRTDEDIRALALSATGKWFAFVRPNRTVAAWELRTGNVLTLTQVPEEIGVKALAFSPDERTLVYATDLGRIKAIDMTTRQRSKEFVSPFSTPEGTQNSTSTGARVGRQTEFLSFSDDGRRLASGNTAGTCIWEVSSRKPIRCIDQYQGEALSSDGSAVITTQNSTVTLWNIDTGSRERSFELSSGRLPGGSWFSANGRWAATVDRLRNGEIDIWDIALGAKSRTVRVFSVSAGAWSLQYFSPDGMWLAASAKNQPIVLADVRTGKELAELAGTAVNNWEVMDPNGHFDAAPEIVHPSEKRFGPYISLDGKLQVLSDLADHYHPGLLPLILGNDSASPRK